jgi:hypothetical protein
VWCDSARTQSGTNMGVGSARHGGAVGRRDRLGAAGKRAERGHEAHGLEWAEVTWSA